MSKDNGRGTVPRAVAANPFYGSSGGRLDTNPVSGERMREENVY